MARSKETTHKIMASVKQKDTEPELLLRHALWKKGLRYRKNYTKLPGKPDIVFVSDRIAVFCDGDFWHGHNWALRGLDSFDQELASYSQFWKDKLIKNINRDNQINAKLESLGWKVIRLWESDIRSDLDGSVNRVIEAKAHNTFQVDDK